MNCVPLCPVHVVTLSYATVQRKPLLKVLFAARAVSVCLHFRTTVCLVTQFVFAWVFVCFALVSLNISAVHSVVFVCEVDIRLLFKRLFNFRNVLKKARAEAPMLVIKISKRHIVPTALEIFFCIETKRSGLARSSTKTFPHRASDVCGRTGYHMTKNNLRLISLKICSFPLIIFWFTVNVLILSCRSQNVQRLRVFRIKREQGKYVLSCFLPPSQGLLTV